MVIQFLGLVLFMLLIVAFVAYFQGGIPLADPVKLTALDVQHDSLPDEGEIACLKKNDRITSFHDQRANSSLRQVRPPRS